MDLFKTAVILAGGKSSRMGFDKQFLEIGSKRLIDIQIEQLSEIFEEIIIVTNEMDKYKDYKVKIFSDEIKYKGPIAGLHVGLKNSSSKYVYFIACDMPNINLQYIRFMLGKIEVTGADIYVTKQGEHIETLNAFYSKKIIEKIEKFIEEGQGSLLSLIKEADTYFFEEKIAREFSPCLDMFINLNTMQDIHNYTKKQTSIR